MTRAPQGAEEVVCCSDCGEPSSGSLAGVGSFRLVTVGYGTLLLCATCAPIRRQESESRRFRYRRGARGR